MDYESQSSVNSAGKARERDTHDDDASQNRPDLADRDEHLAGSIDGRKDDCVGLSDKSSALVHCDHDRGVDGREDGPD